MAKTPTLYMETTMIAPLKTAGEITELLVRAKATQIATEEIGRAIPNTPMMGALMKAMPILKLETILHDIEKKFKSKGEQIVQGNFRAVRRAFEEVKVG